MGSQSAGIGSALPDQTDQSGKVLVTDGTVASWASPDTAALPVQTGHGGEFLTTDGTDPSWTPVTSTTLLPDQTGNSGKVLSTDGLGVLSWIDAAGLALAAFGSTPNADGLTLAAGTLNMEPADGTRPGGVSIAAQTFAGVKTFSDVPVAAGITAPTTTALTFTGKVTDGGSAIGLILDNLTALTTAGAKIASFQNAEVEKAYVDKDGGVLMKGSLVVQGATGALVGTVQAQVGTFFGSFGGLGVGGLGASNYICMSDLTDTLLNAPSGVIYFKIGNAAKGVVNATNLDLTGMGNGGAIKLKDAGGTTRTVTIDAGGAWVIT